MKHVMPPRVVIYAKDVENITGMKNRTARRFLQELKNDLGKTKLGLVTVHEFSKAAGIPEDVVRSYLLD